MMRRLMLATIAIALLAVVPAYAQTETTLEERVTVLEEKVAELRGLHGLDPTEEPTTEPTVVPTEEPTQDSYPPPSTETESVKFIVKCPFSHRAQVDPIVSPGPDGTLSGHMHDFFGNTSTDSDSTHQSMIAAGTTCLLSGDTAAYWTPTLLDADGNPVDPTHMFAYYRNRPDGYGTTQPYPEDFRVIAGGAGYEVDAWWNCFSDEDAFRAPDGEVPFCDNSHLVMNVDFPNCWDGVNTDSADHRSHLVHSNPDDPSFLSGGQSCPESHPVKVPDLRFFVHYPDDSGGPGWRLSTGGTQIHADFWNTWDQDELERLVRECHNASVECGRVTD